VNSATSALEYCEVLIVHDLLAGGNHRILGKNNRSARNAGFRYFISLSAAFHAKVFRTPLFATFGTARAHATPFDSPQCARLIVAYRASSAENLAWRPKAPYSRRDAIAISYIAAPAELRGLISRPTIRVAFQSPFQCGFSKRLALRNDRLPRSAQRVVQLSDNSPPLPEALECCPREIHCRHAP